MNYCTDCTITRDSSQNNKIIKDCKACQNGVATLKKLSTGVHRCFNCLNGFSVKKDSNGNQVGCECDPGPGAQNFAYIKQGTA